MNKKTLNENNDFDYEKFNKILLEKAMERKMISEIKGLNCSIVPEMEFDDTVHTIEPEWNKKKEIQIMGRAIRK